MRSRLWSLRLPVLLRPLQRSWPLRTALLTPLRALRKACVWDATAGSDRLCRPVFVAVRRTARQNVVGWNRRAAWCISVGERRRARRTIFVARSSAEPRILDSGLTTSERLDSFTKNLRSLSDFFYFIDMDHESFRLRHALQHKDVLLDFTNDKVRTSI